MDTLPPTLGILPLAGLIGAVVAGWMGVPWVTLFIVVGLLSETADDLIPVVSRPSYGRLVGLVERRDVCAPRFGKRRYAGAAATTGH